MLVSNEFPLDVGTEPSLSLQEVPNPLPAPKMLARHGMFSSQCRGDRCRVDEPYDKQHLELGAGIGSGLELLPHHPPHPCLLCVN